MHISSILRFIILSSNLICEECCTKLIVLFFSILNILIQKSFILHLASFEREWAFRLVLLYYNTIHNGKSTDKICISGFCTISKSFSFLHSIYFYFIRNYHKFLNIWRRSPNLFASIPHQLVGIESLNFF